MPIFDARVNRCDETTDFETVANQFIERIRGTNADDYRSDFRLIEEAHKERLAVRVVQFFPRLCFPIESSRDPNGLRFVLWKPVLEFLQAEFSVDIEEWFCSQEVALVYLENEAAELVRLIYPTIEDHRRSCPFRREGAVFQVAWNSLCEVELALKREHPGAAAAVERIHQSLTGRGPNDVGIDRIRKELAELMVDAPDWAMISCIDFLSMLRAETKLENNAVFLASQDLLAKDWLRPEEDDAWRHL